MSNTDITRLVVGEPFQKSLGSPVTQQGVAADMPAGSTLRWVDGRWERDAKSLEEHLRSLKLPSPSSIKLRAGRPRWLKLPQAPAVRFAVEVAIAFLIGLPLALYFARPQPNSLPDETVSSASELPGEPVSSASELPLEPRQAEETTGIREVNSSYTPPTEEAPIPDEQDGRVTPTPVQPAKINAPGKPARVVVPTIPARNEPQRKEAEQPKPVAKPQPPVKTPTKETKPQQESAPVILDVDVVREQPRSPNVAAKLPPQMEQRAAQPTPTRLALVAVLPDGKTALFTDPQTRLPVQYKVGDKLTNGETVKSIDSKAGKVTTDKQIYVLE